MEKEIDGFECLYESHLKSQRGVIWKDSVARFSLHGIEQILKLSNELKSGEYEPRPSISFQITKPKPRDILAISYRDRVWQRSINDNIIYPQMTKSFIKENGACQKGKGIDFCLNLFKKQMHRFYINNGTDGYFLQVDIKKYYPSMKHDVVKELFRKNLEPDVYDIVANILDNQYPADTGYNPGSQMVQIAGISLLDRLDHFIKEKLHIKDYIRVMDDMVLIHQDKEYLEHCLGEITAKLDDIGLDINEKKTNIVPLTKGIDFLGFTWRLTQTGKILQFPRSQTVKDFRRTLIKLMKLYVKGERSLHCIEKSKKSRLEYMSKGNNKGLIQKLEKWYKEQLKFYEHKRSILSKENSLAERAGRDDEPESGECGIETNYQRPECRFN